MRKQLEKLQEMVNSRLDAIGNKENPSDKDQELEGALEELLIAIDTVLEALDA